MKRIFLIILTLVMIISLVSCSSSNIKQPSADSENGVDTQEQESPPNEFEGVTVRISDPRGVGGTPHLVGPDYPNNGYAAMFDYGELAKKANINLEITGLTNEERTLKILAEDSDIDIYIFHQADIKFIKDKGIFEPIDSEIIDSFISKTFSDLQANAIDKNGNTVMMPVEYAIQALFIPKQAVEEIGVKPEDIEYLDDFLAYLENYKGKRETYGINDSFFFQLEQQYSYYHCDFDNGQFDYDNEFFRSIYERLLGNYTAYDGIMTSKYSLPIKFDTNSVEKNLFRMTAIGNYTTYTKPEEAKHFFDNFVSFPLPKISDKVEKNMVSVASFAYINPYSKNKEAALKVLEAIAENYFDITGPGGGANLMFKDTDIYPDHIDTDSQVFKEFLEMADNSVILFYNTNKETSLIDFEYLYGEKTLDEAITERSRVVNIMLNE